MFRAGFLIRTIEYVLHASVHEPSDNPLCNIAVVTKKCYQVTLIVHMSKYNFPRKSCQTKFVFFYLCTWLNIILIRIVNDPCQEITCACQIGLHYQSLCNESCISVFFMQGKIKSFYIISTAKQAIEIESFSCLF